MQLPLRSPQARALPKRGEGPAWSEELTVETRTIPDATSSCIARSFSGKGSRLPQSSAAILAAIVQTSLRDACICILVDVRVDAEDVSDALDELLAHAEHPVFVMRYSILCFQLEITAESYMTAYDGTIHFRRMRPGPHSHSSMPFADIPCEADCLVFATKAFDT